MPHPALSSVWREQQLTHMPFLYRDGDLFILLFGRSLFASRRVPQYSRSGTTRIWRLAWVSGDPHSGRWGAVKSFHTGLPLNEVECCPCLSHEGSQVHVSFIGTLRHGTGDLEYRLFRMSGPSLDRLAPAEVVSDEECFSGFWRADLSAIANGRDSRIRLRGSIEAALNTGFARVERLSFDPENPQRLLITGTMPGEAGQLNGLPQPRTVAYDAAHDAVLGEFVVAGSPTYKPAVAGTWAAHVRPNPMCQLRESWTIELDNRFSLIPTTIPVSKTPIA